MWEFFALHIRFRKKKLEACFLTHKHAVKEWGNEIARRYVQRVQIMQATENLTDLMKLPGLRCHPLKGKRAGEYALKLSGFYRLIFTVEGRSLNIVTIEEVSKHYDD